MATPNRNYPIPLTTAPALVPKDLEEAFVQIDADVQTLVDEMGEKVETTDPRLSDARPPTAHTHDDRYYTESETDAKLAAKVGLNPDGTLPPAAEQQVVDLIAADAGTGIQVGGIQPIEGWWLDTEGVFTPPTPDTTPPVVGTLAVSAGSQSATLTVTGASDDRPGLLYAFSKDNGMEYTGWQSGNEYAFAGLTPGAGYTFRHKVRDQAGNEVVGAGVPTTLPDYQSPFREAVMLHGPWQYWPLNDPIGTPLASLNNLGNATGLDESTGLEVKRTLDSMPGTLGAPTLGDGNTAAEILADVTANISIARLSVDLHLHDWTALFLVKLTEPFEFSNLVTGPFNLTLHSSGRLITVTVPATGTKVEPVQIQQADWPGIHMVTMTQTDTRSAVYWDATLIGYIDGPPTDLTMSGIGLGNPAGIYSSVTVLQGKALTAAEVATLHSTLA